jgi:CRISPR system Cascade subunit CasC
MSNAYLDLHVLQTVPPSNVNRDETGSPKTATYGGIRRARVSSQAWKRAIRQDFGQHLDAAEIGVRSKRLVEKIAAKISETDPALSDRSEELAASVLEAAGIKIEKPKRSAKKEAEGADDTSVAESGYLIFLSNLQIDNLAEYAVRIEHEGGKPSKKAVADVAKTGHSFDIALFGRMVADISDLRVDAAAQVAHAISVHAVENEFDYFTAVDDNASGEHAGASMIGTVEFNSSTLYRYATVNLGQLNASLGESAATGRAVAAFVEAFVNSMPTGKQNTFGNRTRPHVVVANLRTDQPVNLVAAFEEGITADEDASRLTRAAEAFTRHAQETDAAFSSPPKASWVLNVGQQTAAVESLGENVDLDGLVAGVTAAAIDHLQESS